MLDNICKVVLTCAITAALSLVSVGIYRELTRDPIELGYVCPKGKR